MGERVALSMHGVTVGKDVSENDVLENHISEKDIEKLEKVRGCLSEDERELLDKMMEG